MSSLTVPGFDVGAADRAMIGFTGVTPNYFSASGIALKSGRGFAVTDDSTAEAVAIVSEGVVRKYFAGRDPILLKACAGVMEVQVPPVVLTREPQDFFGLRQVTPIHPSLP